ncbi:CCHC-type domain-containing protein [Trichonephila clavipes]|nr:CCHC-type domain-containing protein [Trichonephila clavipes]
MPTEQEAKPAVVTPSLQQWRSPSTFRGAPGEDPLKWLKEYDRVANFNKWDDMMCLANVYFFLGRNCETVASKRRTVASLTDETDLVSLIRTIVREEVHRLVNQTQESLDSDPQSLEEIVQDELKGFWPPVSTKPTETRPRPTYAAVTRKYRAPVQKFPPEPRKTDVWRTADNRPVCFHCGRPGHVMRYCRERKAVFDNSRNRRRNFDDVGTEEEIRRPNSSRRFTPSPTRGRFPINANQSSVVSSSKHGNANESSHKKLKSESTEEEADQESNGQEKEMSEATS